MPSETPKIALYNINDLKNATDDAIAPYLTSLKKPHAFQQQHTATDVRLIAGYTAVIIAGILFYADWKLGWDATKAYTAPACVAYFLLNGFFTYWIWAVEAGTIFVGVQAGGQKLTLKSFSTKHTPSYKLKVKYEAPSDRKTIDKEIQGSFTDWFHVNGYLDHKALKAWLAKNIEVIGQAEDLDQATLDAFSISTITTGLDTSSASSRSSKKKA